jgi:hypothetical protein
MASPRPRPASERVVDESPWRKLEREHEGSGLRGRESLSGARLRDVAEQLAGLLPHGPGDLLVASAVLEDLPERAEEPARLGFQLAVR